MDKGWGLALDSDRKIDLFGNNKKSAAGFSLSGGTAPMANRNRGNIFSGFEFPVSLNRREDQQGAPQLPPSDGNRAVVCEVDFFSDKNRSNGDTRVDDKASTVSHVKKENSHEIITHAQTQRKKMDVNTGLHLLLTTNTGSDQSTVDDGISSHAEDKRAKNELVVLQAELQRMTVENERLRGMLSQVSSSYSTLQLHLMTLMQQQQQNRRTTENKHEREIVEGKKQEGAAATGGGGGQLMPAVVPRQFMDLGRGGTTETDELSNSSSEERTQSGSPPVNGNGNENEMIASDIEKSISYRDGKGIGREESPESETAWVPNKVPKLNVPSKSSVDQAATEATMRKARVSVRARSEAPMITDGCQWRKYGQKMAKGNPCPRAYYRCTMAVGCPVRKQVQRCAEDKTILITTYEGTHNHPLPPAAMAMASTTSAAATMLLSGSMSSADGLMNPNFLARTMLPCSSSMATISASAPFPTVTLDLTTSPNPLQFQRNPTQFQVPFPGQPQNFASIPTAAPQVPHAFAQALYNQSQFSGLQLSQDMETSQQAPPQQLLHHSGHPLFADTLSAATAAITADPNFTAALTAAITAIMGGAAQPNNNNSNTATNNTTTTTNTNTTTSNSNSNNNNNNNKMSGFLGNSML